MICWGIFFRGFVLESRNGKRNYFVNLGKLIAMIGLEDAKKILRENRSHLFTDYPIKELAIFGSFARGEAGEDSDIDIMVEFSQPVGFEIVDLVEELEELLQHKVDIVSKKAIRPNVMPFVKKDLVYV